MNAFGLKPLRSHLWAALGMGISVIFPALVVSAENENTESQVSEAAPQAEPPVAAPVIKLEPYVVDETPPKLCFGVSLTVWKNVNTGKVMAIYINRVKERSDALEAGFGPRTRIYRINGKPVEEMSASFNDGSELNRIFINRKLGEKITVEAVPEGSSESKTVTLMERINLSAEIRWTDVIKPAKEGSWSPDDRM